MKILLIILLITLMGCSGGGKQSHEDLPYIDVRKNYPEKEINLTDIADVTYLYLKSDNDDYLYSGGINYVTQNTIVVVSGSSNGVLFFSKEGNPKSRFNRRGQGPEEYTRMADIMYDEATDDVYISQGYSNYINVYSSSGEYKRRLTLPQRNINNQMVLFDDRSILVYDDTKLQQKISKKYSGDYTTFIEPIDSTFFLVSKIDGAVLEYINIPNRNIDLSFSSGDGEFVFYGSPNFTRVRKCPDGFFLYNPETDTVFLYSKDKSLTPYLHKKPLLSDLDHKLAMDICMDAGKYQFMSVIGDLANGGASSAYYARDKNTGEIFRQKIILPDYKEKDFCINPRLLNYYEKEYHFELDLFELKQAYRENRLHGKLKELVATLNENEDNNVFMLVNFK